MPVVVEGGAPVVSFWSWTRIFVAVAVVILIIFIILAVMISPMWWIGVVVLVTIALVYLLFVRGVAASTASVV